MPVIRLASLLAISMLAGCTSWQGHSTDYRNARDLPPLALPEGAQTRPLKPLYPIPPGPVPTQWPEKFEAPAPKPLVLPAGSTTEAVPAQPGAIEKPQLTQDGNGYPLLSVSGDFNAIWDDLDAALRKADVKIDDRDQRVGLYYLTLGDEKNQKTPYQLRLGRGQSAYTLTLQKDDDTLAPQATTRSLFEAIVRHWPEPAAPQ